MKRFLIKRPFGIIINIEHTIERMCLFTFIILGELVAAIVWSSQRREYTEAEAVTLCGLIIAISIQYIYYAGGGIETIHCMHKGTILGVIWNLLHLPLHLSIIILGAAILKCLKTQ